MTKAPRVIVLAGLPAVGLEMLGQGSQRRGAWPAGGAGLAYKHIPGAAAIVADPSIQVKRSSSIWPAAR